MAVIKLSVNGESFEGEIENRILLVDLLRETLALTGTHVGCDTSQCGACVVHVDGKPVKSCSIFAAELNGAEVTTIEGMSNPDGSLGISQQAFMDNHGLQCGFCTSGMVMSTGDLLKTNQNPTDEEIREYLKGNLCRCTGYHNIVKSIKAAARAMAS